MIAMPHHVQAERVFLQNRRWCSARSVSALACWLASWGVTASAQNQPTPLQATNPHPVRPLLLDQNRYRLRAGDRVPIAASEETLTFMRAAKSRSALASGVSSRSFPVAPNVAADQVLLGVPLTTALPATIQLPFSFFSEAATNALRPFR